jgi:DNA modification methylase
MPRNQKKVTPTKRLFRDLSGQEHMFEKSLEEELEAKKNAPVECLGMTFPNDEKRREYFLEKLREKLKDPEFRKIEGFPIGTDEDILALCDPPYYTACPNPFIADFIKYYGKPYDPKTDNYRREPFASDVSEGKNDPIYNAHSYHTKVPHKAIMRYISHYTEPGDLILDCFCGSGMTGVATEALEGRQSVLADLSPAASFISYNYVTPVDTTRLAKEANRILEQIEAELGWLFVTAHAGQQKGTVSNVIWSDVLLCSECNKEIVFWDAAVEWIPGEKGKVASDFDCPHCGADLSKRTLERAFERVFDQPLGLVVRRRKMKPVRISYRYGKATFEKEPDEVDLSLIEKANAETCHSWYPSCLFMNREGQWGDLWRGYHEGFTHAHHFLFKRNLLVLARFKELAEASEFRPQLLAGITAVLKFAGYQNRISPSSTMGLFRTMSGTLYLGSIVGEVNIIESLKGRFAPRKLNAFYPAKRRACAISTSSATDLRAIRDDSMDYVFVDPPFGDNLPYAKLNFIWEAWLRITTALSTEAIVSTTQGKSTLDYGRLMSSSFKEVYRVLKPGRWMTVEFHNSRNSIWSAIQEAIGSAGFVIADIRVLDKGDVLTKKQFTGANAVNRDLVISGYKPNGGLEDRFKLIAGTVDGAWDFVRAHLKQLPVFVSKDGQAEVIAERQNFMLFDRMVAFHVQRGVTVPLSAAEFYQGLVGRFPERDGMFFLPEQAAEYDKKRMTVKEVIQLDLFVIDESSAIQWLKRQLTKKPQTFQELHPQFMKEIGGWEKHERPLELSELLEQNFLRYDCSGDVPSQIHSYLSTNFKELRNLPKDDESLRAKAKDRWYVPDPNKAGDLEKLRERMLMRVFQEYMESKQRKLKVFRLEAVRAGFKKAWQERNYQIIIDVAKKIPEDVLQEDPKLLMWYDQAITRKGDDS